MVGVDEKEDLGVCGREFRETSKKICVSDLA